MNPKNSCLVNLKFALKQCNRPDFNLKRKVKSVKMETQDGEFKLITYLLEFMRAEKGFEEIFSSIGRLTEGMGTLEIPLS